MVRSLSNDRIGRLAPWRSNPWPGPAESIHWGVAAAVACFAAAQLLAGLWAVGVIGLVYGDDGLPDVAERPMWLLLVLGMGLWAGYLGGPALVNRLTGSGPMVDFDLRAGAVQVVGSAAVGVGAQLVLLPLLYVVVTRVLSGDPSATAEQIVDRVDGGLDVAFLVLAVVVMAPLAEEWFYRGMLLSSLGRRFGPTIGVVASSLVFAAIHGELILLPGLFVFALLLAALATTTGRLGPPIVAHMAFNATTVVQLLT